MPGLTTDALFVRIAPSQTAQTEHWRRISDLPQNRQLPDVVEYSGEVLDDSLMGESADTVENNDYIRFKNVALSSAGLIDQSALQEMIRRDRATRQESHNPATRETIAEPDIRLIMNEPPLPSQPPLLTETKPPTPEKPRLDVKEAALPPPEKLRVHTFRNMVQHLKEYAALLEISQTQPRTKDQIELYCKNVIEQIQADKAVVIKQLAH